MIITLTANQKSKLQQIIDNASNFDGVGAIYTYVDVNGNFTPNQNQKEKTIRIFPNKDKAELIQNAAITVDSQEPIFFETDEEIKQYYISKLKALKTQQQELEEQQEKVKLGQYFDGINFV